MAETHKPTKTPTMPSKNSDPKPPPVTSTVTSDLTANETQETSSEFPWGLVAVIGGSLNVWLCFALYYLYRTQNRGEEAVSFF
eukprot:UN06131